MKTIRTDGQKCKCGYGQNISVTIPEQSDIDNAVLEMTKMMEKETGAPLSKEMKAFVIAQVKKSIPNSHLVWSKKLEAKIREEQEEVTERCGIAVHCNEDGSCAGKVTDKEGIKFVSRAHEWSGRPWMSRALANNTRARQGLALLPDIPAPGKDRRQVKRIIAMRAKVPDVLA